MLLARFHCSMSENTLIIKGIKTIIFLLRPFFKLKWETRILDCYDNQTFLNENKRGYLKTELLKSASVLRRFSDNNKRLCLYWGNERLLFLNKLVCDSFRENITLRRYVAIKLQLVQAWTRSREDRGPSCRCSERNHLLSLKTSFSRHLTLQSVKCQKMPQAVC